MKSLGSMWLSKILRQRQLSDGTADAEHSLMKPDYVKTQLRIRFRNCLFGHLRDY